MVTSSTGYVVNPWPRKRISFPSPIRPWSSCCHFLDVAHRYKKQFQETGRNDPGGEGKVLACIFEKPSLRTRVSFEVAMYHLGGTAIYIAPGEIGLGVRESVADVARVLSGMVDGIMARVFEHAETQGTRRTRHRPGDQRPVRLLPSLPGHGRPDDRRGAFREAGGADAGVCRRRQQRGPLADGGLRQVRGEVPDRLAAGVRTGARAGRPDHGAVPGPGFRVRPRSARRRGPGGHHLHRYLGVHGPGGGEGAAPAGVPARIRSTRNCWPPRPSMRW